VTRLRGERDAHQAELAAARQRLEDLGARLAQAESRLEKVVEGEGDVHRPHYYHVVATAEIPGDKTQGNPNHTTYCNDTQ
ncbi:MAG: hypothetical protein ACE5Q6_24240, partial [Dehalococcoidia bacterium]